MNVGAQGLGAPTRRPSELASAKSEAGTDVVFVVMPFADVRHPAIGVSLLQAAVTARGYSSRIEYCNLPFADRIGRERYNRICNGTRSQYLVGEWIFAEDVFGDQIPPADEYVRHVLAPNVPAEIAAGILEARELRTGFVEACAERIMGYSPRVVGFTTTFHQTCASLAVAARLKQRADAPAIAFGGANCEGVMGVQMLESFPWIDAVSTGEADRSFPRMLDALLEGRDERIGGVRFRGQAGGEHPTPAVPLQDLDALPVPDFDDYFRAVDALPSGPPISTRLVIETSRGCWWGAKHHCTFCGLNGETMAFRSKSPQRVYDEVTYLADRHGSSRVECVDNILDLHYLDTLLPKLAESPLELRFFYEVKANLRHDQLRKMRDGGIRDIQPGIESLSSQVLRLMEKGVTGLQNVQLLRWCTELGMSCTWSIISGFPGEDPEEYRRMRDLIPLVVHLEPPISSSQLRLDRFSPNHTDSERLGFSNVRPSLAYAMLFPIDAAELDRLAYYFDYDYADGRVPRTYVEQLREPLTTWRDTWAGKKSRARLDAETVGDKIVVTDTRPIARAARHELEGVAAQVYLACDRISTPAALLRAPELAGRDREVHSALEDLAEQRLLISDEGRYLSLAVFRSRPSADHGATGAQAPARVGVAVG